MTDETKHEPVQGPNDNHMLICSCGDYNCASLDAVRASWAKIMVVAEESTVPEEVADGGGTLEPEKWVRAHGVRNYPRAIYFFAEE